MQRSFFFALVMVVLLVTVVALALVLSERQMTVPDNVTAALPKDIGKPKPVADYFQGCPPSGSGGDPALNTLKNRVDEGQWQTTTISALLQLPWPRAIENRPRSRWSAAEKAAIAQHEGAPVQVEGYLTSAKRMSPETTNCHSKQYVDFHIWMVDDVLKDRTQSVVIETSPRVQSVHPEWTLSRIREIASRRERVRISGWLLMDPEHPDQIGKTRGTIWEIHPVMQIETLVRGQWRPLDNGTTGIASSTELESAAPSVVPVETATNPPNNNPAVQDNHTIRITGIFFDGTKGSNEPDEYVEITNAGREAVDITDWELQDVTGSKEFKWESYILQPGAKIRVYTNELHEDTGGFSYRSGRALWGNRGDIAELYDADKELISRFAYGDKK